MENTLAIINKEEISTLEGKIKTEDEPFVKFAITNLPQWPLDKPILLIGRIEDGTIAVISRGKEGEVSQMINNYFSNGGDTAYIIDITDPDIVYKHTK